MSEPDFREIAAVDNTACPHCGKLCDGCKATPRTWFAGTVADPSISRGIDGRLTLNWDADAPDHCVVHRVALVDLITEMGGLNDEIDRMRAANDHAWTELKNIAARNIELKQHYDALVADWWES